MPTVDLLRTCTRIERTAKRPLVGEYMGCDFMHSTVSLFLLARLIVPEIVWVNIFFSVYAAHALASACCAGFVHNTILFFFRPKGPFVGRQMLFFGSKTDNLTAFKRHWRSIYGESERKKSSCGMICLLALLENSLYPFSVSLGVILASGGRNLSCVSLLASHVS